MAALAPLIVILGPTASGKTSAGIELAKKIGGEIICADSRTVYKGMDIGTAKPTIEEQNGIPHHMIDLIEPDQRFSAADFKEHADTLINEIWARGNFPLMVGGTGLYIDSVLFNYRFSGIAAQRSDDNPRHSASKQQLDRAGGVRDNSLILGISVDKELLRERIEARVQEMFADGFLAEVKALSEKYGWVHESMSGIGYRLAKSYFDGEATEEEVKQVFVSRDLSLAKRQRTWFKRNPYIKWYEDKDDLILSATEFSSKFRV